MQKNEELDNVSVKENDSLTGLITYEKFCDIVGQLIADDRSGVENGEYAVLYMDILRFKVINDIFGVEEGDRFLVFMANVISEICMESGIAARISSDRFAVFIRKKGEELEEMLENYLSRIASYPLTYEIVSNVGVYVTNSSDMTVVSMLDRAILAHSFIKGDYIQKYNYYDSTQRDTILGEQEIAGMMNAALEAKHFIIYYQPQYDHINGSIVGAEALVRWNHPKRGIIPPGRFIPIFEKNGFITKVDIYVFEEVCAFIRRQLDAKKKIIPISVNVSRRDIYQPAFIENMEYIRKKYSVPVSLIRVEITESAVIEGIKRITEFINELHKIGYVVEMDDFGSGYSSLNSLKSIDLDVLKLDMGFLSEDGDRKQGAIIMSSVVRMAKWLGFSIIAEGVENIEEAQFLQSIGCCYMQGYYYAKPLPEDDFIEILATRKKSFIKPAMNIFSKMDVGKLWDIKSMDTMLFNNFVGGACIFAYGKEKQIELLRVNNNYFREIGNRYEEEKILKFLNSAIVDDENYQIYINMLERALQSGVEEECETWRSYSDNVNERVCIRATVRLIGESLDSYVFYSTIRNVTLEKLAVQKMHYRENLFKMASEQINLYYWVYDFDSKTMKPCFRCMRDFRYPAVINDYPKSLFETGQIPAEYEEMYTAVIKRLENGEPGAEIELPLGKDKTMFKVRYTTEFNDNGTPLRAYGTASLF